MKKFVVFVGVVALAGAAWGQAPSQKCEAARNREAGKYTKCLLKAEGDLVAKKGLCSAD